MVIVNTNSIGQISDYKPNFDCEEYNYYAPYDSSEYLRMISDSILPSGILLINAESWESVGDIDSVLQEMGVIQGYSFELEKHGKVPMQDERVYFRYKQLYDGIPVEGGGYTVFARADFPTTIDPCLDVYMFSPFIVSRININTTPTIAQSSIKSILENNLDTVTVSIDSSRLTSNLIISFNLDYECSYNLVWKSEYLKDNRPQASWIDAHTGTILKTKSLQLNIEAPTMTYGTVVLDDTNLGNSILLQTSDERVTTYDFGSIDPDPLNRIWPDSLIPSTTNMVTWGSEATPHVYQSHYVTTEALRAFDDANIEFGNVSVAALLVLNSNAISYGGSNSVDCFIGFGLAPDGQDSISLSLYDVAAHEMGHCFVFDFIQYSSLGNRTLHEALADMFGVYGESIIQDSIDWVMGDDEPVIANLVMRDLTNPLFDCVDDIIDLQERYARGGPLRYWFYLISAGSTTLDIPTLGIDRAMEIVVGSLPGLSTESDYGDFRAAVMAHVLSIYGICSDEYTAVALAWNEICFGTFDVCPYTITSSTTTLCEEHNYLKLCVKGGLSGAGYRWYFPIEWTVIGSEGNIYEGNCLEVTNFPNYPYYPRRFTIRIYSPTVGVEFNQLFSVILYDCDNDDPKCGDLLLMPEQSDYIQEDEHITFIESGDINKQEEDMMVRVFDLSGRMLFVGTEYKAMEFLFENRSYIPHLLLLAYFDQEGKFLFTTKRIRP